MYSCADRTRAVKLYIKLGKRTEATIRQLGYPTKNALKGWYRESEGCRAQRMGYVLEAEVFGRAKRLAVDHYLTHDRFIAATRKALGTPCRQTLAGWVAELHPHAGGNAAGSSAPEPTWLSRFVKRQQSGRRTYQAYRATMSPTICPYSPGPGRRPRRRSILTPSSLQAAA
jgi:hypothetical protein